MMGEFNKMRKTRFFIVSVFILLLLINIKQNVEVSFAKSTDNPVQDQEEDNFVEDYVTRFVGQPETNVWQIYCTEMWDICHNNYEYKEPNMFDYDTIINSAKSYANISNIDEHDKKIQHHLWERRIKEGYTLENTGYYQLELQLEYYILYQKDIGEPVSFDYNEYEQSLIDKDAKNGVSVDISQTLVPASTASSDEEVRKKNINNTNPFVTFLLEGGFTLIVTAILGIVIVIMYIYKKRKQED